MFVIYVDKKNSGEVIGKVRDVPDMSVLKCKTCGLVFLENFDHIDDNFYERFQDERK